MLKTSSIFKHLRQVLQQTYFLHNLGPYELDQLVINLEPMRVFKGFEIVRQGEPGDAFYLIAKGNVSVWMNKEGGRVKVAELRSSEYFGEMSLMSDEPRNATVIAEGMTELFVLKKIKFEKILLKSFGIADKLKQAFAERAIKNKAEKGTNSSSELPPETSQ